MATNPFTVTLGKITTTSIEVITSGGPEVDPWIFDLYAGSSATGTVLATATTGTEDQAYTFTGLTPNTTYTIKAHSNEDSGYDTVLTTTTLVNDPKTATRSQWEDLADRVQSKAEIGAVLSTPSSVAYVGANNIMNNAVTSDKIDFSTLAFGNYSTTEQDTGFTWTDGQTIYKKTFSTTTGTNDGSTKTIAHSISGFASLVRAEGTVLNGTQYWQIPTSFGSEGWAAIRADSTNIYLNVYGNSLAGKSCSITLYYTKSN